MRRNKWRGTILFAVILVVMGATVGLKLYDVGQSVTPAAVASVVSTPTDAATSSASPSTTSSSTPSTASTTKVITGAVEETRYGPIQLQVTFDGTKITAVKELQYPSDDRRSESINAQALPILDQEALSSQSAHIDTVSGATYTSEGYKQSLQSAIDKL
jgi:uncharacterized protein with FMN-binding domain